VLGATKRFRQRRWGVLTACIPLAAVALPVGAPPAAASLVTTASKGAPAAAPLPPGPWVILTTPDPSGDWGSGALDALRGVSCVSPTFCMAAGSYVPRPVRAGVYRSFPLFELWDGTTWAVLASPTGGGISGISCSSAHFCMAIGVTNVNNGGSHLGEFSLAEVWRGARWSVVTSPPPPPGVPAYEAQLASVTCTSRNSCVVVGSYGEKRSPGVQTLIESWDGSRWSLNHSPSPGGPPGGLNALSAVSCSAAGGAICSAVGYEAASTSGHAHAIVEVDHHGTWSLDLAVGTASSEGSHLYGVSCNLARRCVAVGNLVAGTSDQLLEGDWDGQTWGVVPTPPSAVVGVAVTCGSAGTCTEVGPSGEVATLESGTWTAAPTPPRNRVSASSISCTASICMAVGDYVAGDMTHTWAEYRRMN
jgi:hypothetical protein